MTETLILTAARADEEPSSPARSDARWPAPTCASPSALMPGDDLGPVEMRSPSLFERLPRTDPTPPPPPRPPTAGSPTGDIGRWTASGALAIVGRRATDLIKSGGYKIGAGEIENALLEHAGVAEAAVVGVPDDDLGERIVAHVVPAGERPTERELIDHVARCSPRTSGRGRSGSPTRCPATTWARS